MGSHSGGGTATGGGGDPPSVIDIFVLLPGQRELKEGRRNDVFIGNSRRRKETAKSTLGLRGESRRRPAPPLFYEMENRFAQKLGRGRFRPKVLGKDFPPSFSQAANAGGDISFTSPSFFIKPPSYWRRRCFGGGERKGLLCQEYEIRGWIGGSRKGLSPPFRCAKPPSLRYSTDIHPLSKPNRKRGGHKHWWVGLLSRRSKERNHHHLWESNCGSVYYVQGEKKVG